MAKSLRFKQKDFPKVNPSKEGNPESRLGKLLNAERKIREKGMNKTETDFSNMLEKAKAEGEILRWEFEPVSLKTGPNTRYNPDFLIVLTDHHWQFVEIKGYLRDDAAVKFKTCAEKYPELSFMMIKKKKGCAGEWEIIYNLPSPIRKPGMKSILDPDKKTRKTQA